MLLKEFLEPMETDLRSLAEEIGISYEHLNGIVDGRREITHSIADGLAKALGTTSSFWMNLQEICDRYSVSASG